VPRLHAISVAREADAAAAAGPPAAALRARAGELRGRALAVLAAALGGDTLAAQYLLLQLVSRCGLPPISGSHHAALPSPSVVHGPERRSTQQSARLSP
jgi:hypothetical protein